MWAGCWEFCCPESLTIEIDTHSSSPHYFPNVCLYIWSTPGTVCPWETAVKELPLGVGEMGKLSTHMECDSCDKDSEVDPGVAGELCHPGS